MNNLNRVWKKYSDLNNAVAFIITSQTLLCEVRVAREGRQVSCCVVVA